MLLQNICEASLLAGIRIRPKIPRGVTGFGRSNEKHRKQSSWHCKYNRSTSTDNLEIQPAMLSTVQSGAINGLDAIPIQVEVDYNPRGMTNFTIVRLPDAAVQESKERVRAAVKNRGL